MEPINFECIGWKQQAAITTPQLALEIEIQDFADCTINWFTWYDRGLDHTIYVAPPQGPTTNQLIVTDQYYKPWDWGICDVKQFDVVDGPTKSIVLTDPNFNFIDDKG